MKVVLFRSGSIVAGILSLLGSVSVQAGSWSQMGSPMFGCNREPLASAALPNGDIIVGGPFETCGTYNPNMKGVARWQASTNTWHALGTGTNKAVNAIVVVGTDVYVGGGFTNAGGVITRGIAKWDSVSDTWSSLGTGIDSGSSINALYYSNGALYAGGAFSSIGGVEAKNIAWWNGGVWSPLGYAGNGTNGAVNAIAASGDGIYFGIYVGGSFTQVLNGGVWVNSNRVALWNGVWMNLGAGFNASVQALSIHNGELYAGGIFTHTGGVPAKYVARWDALAWAWVTIGDGLDGGSGSGVGVLSSADGLLYVGGLFTQAGLMPANHIATWDGIQWSPLMDGINNGVSQQVYSIAVLPSGGGVVVTGRFNTAGSVVVQKVGRWFP